MVKFVCPEHVFYTGSHCNSCSSSVMAASRKSTSYRDIRRCHSGIGRRRLPSDHSLEPDHREEHAGEDLVRIGWIFFDLCPKRWLWGSKNGENIWSERTFLFQQLSTNGLRCHMWLKRAHIKSLVTCEYKIFFYRKEFLIICDTHLIGINIPMLWRCWRKTRP